MRKARGTHGDYGFARRTSCDCDLCRRAISRYAKTLRLDKARGRVRTVPAAPVREHVQGLLDAGAQLGQVSRAAEGLVHSQVMRLMNGDFRTGKPITRLAPRTAQILMGVTLQDAFAQWTMTNPVGTRRRIQALAARGFSKADIAAEVGVSGSAVFNWMYRESLSTDVVAKVKAAYDRMHMREGDSELMRWRARREGWLPPLAWDEHTIDDPDAEPDLSAVKCVVEHCHRSVQRRCLCKSHSEMVSRHGGYKSSKEFRRVVLMLGGKNKRQVHDTEALREQLADLREIGVDTPEAAARALGRGRKYVEKVWKDVS